MYFFSHTFVFRINCILYIYMYTTHDPTGAHLIHIHGIKRLLVDLFVAYQKPDRCGITLYSKGQVMRVTLRAIITEKISKR